jgi:hypothetical protein
MHHPERNPKLNKVCYIQNSVFAVAQTGLTLYISEGASLQEAAELSNSLQQAIKQAYAIAVANVASDFTGPMPEPPDFSDDNPFLGPDDDTKS